MAQLLAKDLADYLWAKDNRKQYLIVKYVDGTKDGPKLYHTGFGHYTYDRTAAIRYSQPPVGLSYELA